MIFGLAILGAFVAFIPMASFILIPMEGFMIYRISKKYDSFDFVQFIAIFSALGLISGTLKGVATVLHTVPLVGQFANSLVAAGFIIVLGLLAEQFYSRRSKT